VSFDFASAQAKLRRKVQKTFGVAALYSDSLLIEPVDIVARFINPNSMQVGDLQNGGYAQIEQGSEQVALIHSDYPDLVFNRGGRVELTSLGFTVILQVKMEITGPVEQIWQVTRV